MIGTKPNTNYISLTEESLPMTASSWQSIACNCGVNTFTDPSLLPKGRSNTSLMCTTGAPCTRDTCWRDSYIPAPQLREGSNSLSHPATAVSVSTNCENLWGLEIQGHLDSNECSKHCWLPINCACRSCAGIAILQYPLRAQTSCVPPLQCSLNICYYYVRWDYDLWWLAAGVLHSVRCFLTWFFSNQN